MKRLFLSFIISGILFYSFHFIGREKAAVTDAVTDALTEPKFSANTVAINDGYSISDLRPPFINGIKEESKVENENEEEEFEMGPELQVEYFKHWYYPYGNILPQTVQQKIWDDVNRLPKEPESEMPVNSWRCVGPWRQNITYGDPGRSYTGRILDIEILPSYSMRIAAASGGIWQQRFSYTPMTEALNTQATSCIYTDIAHYNEIYVGTGEATQMGGTGLWKSNDEGITWNMCNLNPGGASAFYRIKHNPRNPNELFAASDAGLYKSVDRGFSWNRKLPGNVTDIGINPSPTPVYMYAAIWGDGIYRSTNAGENWTKLTTGGIPSTNIGRSSITVSQSNPNIAYVCLARNDNSDLLGIYKTSNNGTNWENKSPGNFMGGIGWYANVISVSPTNPNIVLAGSLDFVRSDNGGSGWSTISRNMLHPDHHAIKWEADGMRVYSGNDGGMAFSGDAGINWSTSVNYFPITQFVNFDVGTNNTGVIAGGSQDNGFAVTTNGGFNWNHTLSGDCGGFSIDPNNATRMFGVAGVYEINIFNPFAFKRKRSDDFGRNWSDINWGIDGNGGGQWYNKVRNDKSNPVYIYNNLGPFVYSSSNYGNDWFKMNTTAFPEQVNELTVSKYSSGIVILYACMNKNNGNTRLKVYEGGSWLDRAGGLTDGTQVRKVAVHPTNLNKSYALMNGIGFSRIFKTTNRGINWIDITGDLGVNIPVSDLIPHPLDDNKLYLGTGVGCFRTTNGGTNWQRWNNGMPEANIVSEMKYIDSLSVNGKFYVAAATYGRSIWTREVSGDDPIGISNNNTEIPDKFEIEQNYPNPFNPVTIIRYGLPKNVMVSVKVYDIAGREVRTIVNEQQTAGYYEVTFDGIDLASGVYFYRIEAGDFVQTKKMMLIK